ncbi:MAG: hypothetical protein ACR2IP_10790, partial [Solirubrobacteraceae bacterium]
MSPQPPEPPRRPYWLLLPLAALLLSPPAWAAVGLVAVAAGAALVAGIQRARAARALDAAAARPHETVVLGAGQRGDTALLYNRQPSAHGPPLGASG